MVRTESVSLNRDSTAILHNINVTCANEVITAVCGAAGSGKTLLLRTLAGKIKPSKGFVIHTIQNRQTVASFYPPDILRQDNSMSLYEFIIHHTGSIQQHVRKRIIDFSGILGIEPYLSHSISQLNDACIKKALLVCAFAVRSGIYLLDNPDCFLDPSSKLQVITLMKHIITSESVPLLFATHDINFSLSCAHRHILLKSGTLLFEGKTADVSEEHITQTYNVEVSMQNNPVTGTGECFFYNQV